MAAELTYCGQDTAVRTGTAGAPGVGDQPGGRSDAGSVCYAGSGGSFGTAGEDSSCFGSAPGGASGFSIELHDGGTTNVPSGSYGTGNGNIRGPVGVGP